MVLTDIKGEYPCWPAVVREAVVPVERVDTLEENCKRCSVLQLSKLGDASSSGQRLSRIARKGMLYQAVPALSATCLQEQMHQRKGSQQ